MVLLEVEVVSVRWRRVRRRCGIIGALIVDRFQWFQFHRGYIVKNQK